MNDELNPYEPPQSSPAGAPPPNPSYRPWTRGRVYMIFILGMHAAGFMMFFIHPVFALIGLGFGIPTVILANREIEEFPGAELHPFIKWGKLAGKIAVIAGPIVIVLWIIVAIVAIAVGVSM